MTEKEFIEIIPAWVLILLGLIAIVWQIMDSASE